MLFDSFATYNEVSRNRARMASAFSRLSGTSDQIALLVVAVFLVLIRLR